MVTPKIKQLTYSDDAIYRLSQATPTGGTGQPETYTYDPVGNRLTKVPDTPPAANEAVIYSYDDENRLTGVQITANNKIKQLSFTYDPFGRRIAKSLTKDEIGTDCQSPNICPRTTNYVYDNQSIILEYQNSNITARYTQGLGIDEPLAVTQNTNTYFYHSDGLGSITAMTNTSGAVVQTYSYDSFGNMTQTGNISQPYTYTAREYDTETGMFFYRARYYDPKAGRFITRDPIGFDGGDFNLYVYVKNNPVNLVDPYGLSTCEDDCNKFRNTCYLAATIGGVSCNVACYAACVLATDGTGVVFCRVVCAGLCAGGTGALQVYCYKASQKCTKKCNDCQK
jgi:RHS repeat-associated protein